MSGRYAAGSIAEQVFQGTAGQPCRVDVLDGEGLKGTLTGSSVEALDFTVHTQLSERGAYAVHFGVRVSHLPIALLNQIVSAMETALGTGDDFAVVLADSLAGSNKADDFNVRAVPDFAAQGGKYYTRGVLNGDFVKDVVFRFISTGEGSS
jgi:hypothetical protein